MSKPIIITDTTRPYQMCNCCIMDTSDSYITFDEKGVCGRCNEFKTRILPEWNYGNGHEEALEKLIEDIKESGKGKQYDCILGLSGGLDSSYMLHLAIKEWGLRPFVFHIDAGWNLPIAEKNIKKMTDKLGVELHIEKMDWDEIREMQLAWFKTGLEALDAPQDHAFIALIDRFSLKLGVKYILNGYNISTEIVADPASWAKGAGPTGDRKYMKDVIKKYCRIPIKKYTFTDGFVHKFWMPYVKRVKTVKPLNLVPVTRQQMIDVLQTEYDYEPYEQKHFEDLLTKFIEGWWNPTRFGHDIRRAQLSSLVVTGQMSREEALRVLEQPPLSVAESQELFTEVAKRLGISNKELDDLHNLPECTVRFQSKRWMYKIGIKVYEALGLEKRIRK